MTIKALQRITAYFAALANGVNRGGNSSDTETFPKFFAFLVEIIQNSLDARDSKEAPVVVEFSRLRTKTADFPAAAELRSRMEMFEAASEGNAKSKAFFENARRMFEKREIESMLARDYNTRGAEGDDDDTKSPWYLMTKTIGSTVKKNGGGSHGIGKCAAMAASQIRTVLYGTRLPNGDRKFRGMTLGVSHSEADGPKNKPPKWQDAGLIGSGEGETVTDPKLIPPFMSRSETGTDVLIAAHEFKQQWIDSAMLFVLEKWWPAIEEGDLEVVFKDGFDPNRAGRKTATVDDGVATAKVSKANIQEMMDAFKDNDARPHWEAFKNGQKKTHQTDTIGPCETYVSTGPKFAKNSFAMIREIGLVVFHKGFWSDAPFCGVFRCSNEKGDGILRQMEPPAHDKWDPDELQEGELGKKAEADFMGVIRSVVEEINRSAGFESSDIPSLAEILPMDDEDDAEQGAWGDSKEDRKAEPIGRGDPEGKKKPKERKKGPYRLEEALVAIIASARDGEYEFHLESPEGHEAAFVAVGIAGESDEVEVVMAEWARADSGEPLGVDPEHGVVGPLALKRGGNRISIKIAEKRKMSTQVYRATKK